MSSFRLVGDSAILCIALAIGTGGCGGKTDGQEGGGEVGTTAAGGTGAGIGGTGGMAGEGPGGEGPGGEGPGGEGGVGGNVTVEQQMMLDICVRLAAMDCVATLGGKSGCVSLLSKQLDVAATRGCVGQYLDLLMCTWTEPSVCRQGKRQAPFCGQATALMQCMNRLDTSCGVAHPIPPLQLFGDNRDADGTAYCSMDCTDYGFQCQRQTNEALSCQCTFGRNAGFTFNQINCAQGFATAQELCRGG